MTESNIMKYLGVIEAKTVEIVDNYKGRLACEGVDISAFKRFMVGPDRPTGKVVEMMHIDAPRMTITHLSSQRSDDVKKAEKKLERAAGPVAVMSRDAIRQELEAQSREKTQAKRRKGLSKKLKLAGKMAVKEDKIIEML